MNTAAAPHPRPTTGGTPRTPVYATRTDADTARAHLSLITTVNDKLPRFLTTVGTLCLIFTAANVTFFAIDHNVHPLIAWMLDPLVSLTLVFCLWVEGKLGEVGVKSGNWPGTLRWFAGLATWLMNCWSSLYPDGVFRFLPDHPDPAGLLLHSVPPVLLICLAEASAAWRKQNIDKTAQLNAVIDSYEAGQRAAKQAEKDRVEAEAERQRAAERAKAAQTEAEAERLRAEEQAEREAERARRAAAEEAALEERRRDAAAERELKRRQFEAQQRREEEDRRRQQEREDAERRAAAERARREEEEARRAAEAEAEARHQAEQKAEAERKRQQRAAEHKARKESATAQQYTSKTAQTHPADGDHGMSHGQRKAQREEAITYAAKVLAANEKITAEALGAQYGNSESWGRNQINEAKRRLADEESGYRDRIETELLEEMVKAER